MLRYAKWEDWSFHSFKPSQLSWDYKVCAAKYVSHIQTLLPLVAGPFMSFIKPSQLPGEYTVCAACSALSWINHMGHLWPHRTHLLVVEEKQFKLIVLLKDTSVMTGIRTHTLMTRVARSGVHWTKPVDPQHATSLVENHLLRTRPESKWEDIFIIQTEDRSLLWVWMVLSKTFAKLKLEIWTSFFFGERYWNGGGGGKTTELDLSWVYWPNTETTGLGAMVKGKIRALFYQFNVVQTSIENPIMNLIRRLNTFRIMQ